MSIRVAKHAVCAAALAIAIMTPGRSLGNGGPFVIKYPNGDPAARGTFARLDPSLKPAQEDRLRVVKEDLKITFLSDRSPASPSTPPDPPLAAVSAQYTIENPTDQDIDIDFGFPILRGIYTSRFTMMPSPDVRVTVKANVPGRPDNLVHAEIISNSAIYGLIRHRARTAIEAAVARDAALAKLVATARATGIARQRARKAIGQVVESDVALAKAVVEDRLLGGLAAGGHEQPDADHDQARSALADYLAKTMKWKPRDVALMVEFASLDFGLPIAIPPDRTHYPLLSGGHPYINANLGSLGAIGEQKATQFFATLAARFDPAEAATYEAIFTAWGGDVRERSVDLATGQVRPREITIDADKLGKDRNLSGYARSDPTIYARVDYLDPKARISDPEKASCKTVLKNLPVIFTFAPMNLVHYRVQFPARTTQTLTVEYKQYAYKDTRDPTTYQIAYVLHPASLWKDFGPIHLEVATPSNIPFRASVDCKNDGTEERTMSIAPGRNGGKTRLAIHRATLAQKTGELFLAIDAKAWDRRISELAANQPKQQARR
ncbi:MAG: hypothetical protein JXQ73_12240 [Phycisphaerae bacterium]|nr:hypothetical protein [Phycisphaerae bacterium]